MTAAPMNPDRRLAEPSYDPPASFGRSLQAQHAPQDRLQRGAELAVELVDGCDHAGVTIASTVAVESAAATDDLVRRGDALQYELSEGPCLEAVRRRRTVISPDLAIDRRWPTWAPKVRAELGVRAMMSVLLYTERGSLGALNLYADHVGAWTPHSLAVAYALADQLSAALADAREIEHRGRAMIGRTTIGQAQGIVMERLGLDADQAFAYLRRLSQTQHLKLLVVAEELVRTLRLPDHPPHETGRGDDRSGTAEPERPAGPQRTPRRHDGRDEGTGPVRTTT